MRAELTAVQNVVNSLAVFAFLGMVIALFAISALLRIVRELQQAVLAVPAAPGPDAVRRVPRFASADGRPTFVLVVSEQCPSCRDRAAHLAGMPPGRVDGRLVLLSAGEACAAWAGPAPHVEAVVDADLLGSVAVGATPSLVKYAPDGAEEWRRVVGSDPDLDRLLGVDLPESSNVR
ncbi:hypothetical protein GT755_34455 [Herbidospora sp. NEAU-GS84]|uniref:Thioredoxin domain-containing protein n=1 Tax=Herbidospora solisilvae TaxID=2696284 RepID=A0A7C9J7H6_9ACTN|nr:hypothetical protein [Herbidospora solisilvae]NAS26762.1 hypothetical protein [Herbidospora solisilvae]